MTLMFKETADWIWEIELGGRVVGQIRYLGEWGYCFCPFIQDWGAYFTIDWMREITNFCLEKTRQRDVMTTRTAT